MRSAPARLLLVIGAATLAALLAALPAAAQIRAWARPTTPPWTKGIQPISPETYYNAIECGKQGGADPACVFWDTGLCKNPDFELALYSPYKMVAYDVWRNVSQNRPAPQPNYAEAQRTRVTVGITPVRGSTNSFKDFILKRGGTAVEPTARSVPGRRFTYDFPAFSPRGAVTLEIIGTAKTVSCTIPPAVLATFR
jgi:hypothetical protein